ncbi:MAG: DUF3301 domain-containing protein [Spongiibacteraceae bacterium]
MIELADLFWLLALAVIAAYWWQAHAIKEMALQVTRKRCQDLDVQLLDETVVMRGLWLRRGDDGVVHWWRSYLFEFTATGDDRYPGSIEMLGKRVVALELAPHRLN